ncbi:tetratricopeptide repeat protein [Nitratireductor sp. XY-223]|uniref:tetratricopeptide repeat protein n=1 Tax=Nitratireductor sp. XY-223 TaxID=2561926 RepID=UPI001FEE8061|nr:tetratricopeptide repeat protein [Nitratireductor sp. XY-223]
MYQRAIGLDQTFAPAYAGLAWAQNHEGNQGWSEDRETAIGEAFETARKALTLDRRLARAHSVMGDIQLWRRQHRDSVSSGFKAVECDPSHADSRMVYAYCLSMNGEVDKALKQSRLALRHNPLRANRIYYSALGHACFNNKDYSGARKAAVEGIRRDARHRGLRLLHAAALAKLGEFDGAKREATAVLALDPDLRCSALSNIWPYRSKERIEEFAEMLADCGLPP